MEFKNMKIMQRKLNFLLSHSQDNYFGLVGWLAKK